MSSHSLVSIELNPVESFSFMFNNLWSPPSNSKSLIGKFKLSILDTILFKDGVPRNWLFTSDKFGGEILKKRSDKLDSFAGIISSLKTRSKSLKSLKEPYLSKKIANVWYVQSDSVMTSYLVNETELYDILKDTMREIVAVQIFIGGVPLKNGNGIFEHHMFHDKHTGKPKHHSFELLKPLENGYDASNFDNNTLKIEINEKRHESLKNMCNRLIRQINEILNYKVDSITFQVVFNSDFIPLLMNVRHLKMFVPVDFKLLKDQIVYLGGTPPIPPVFDGDSLLPLIWLGEVRDQNNSKDELHKSPIGLNNNKSISVHSNDESDLRNPERELSAKDFEDLFISADNDSAAIQRLTGRLDIQSLKIPPIKRKLAVSKIRYDLDDDAAMVAGLIASSHIKDISGEKDEVVGKKTQFRIPEETRAMRNAMNFIVEKSICRRLPSSKNIKESLVSSKSKDALNVARNTDNAITNSHRFESLNRYKSIDGVVSKVRPSSAPTTSRVKIRDNKVPETPQDTGRRGSGVSLRLPISRGSCHGDYCSIKTRVMDGISFQFKEIEETRATHAPNKLYYKSILLARAEAKFLGFDIMHNLSDAVWTKFGSRDVQVDQVLHYFVKRHINAIALNCSEEANDIRLKDWTDNIEVLYRRMIYAEALKNFKHSRLYSSVPICHICYQTYCFMDMQREEQILKPIQSAKTDGKLSMMTIRQNSRMEGEEKMLMSDSDNNLRKEMQTRKLAKTIVTQIKDENNLSDPIDRVQATISAGNKSSPEKNREGEDYFPVATRSFPSKIPLNFTNRNNFDTTIDKGIGSKGPIHKDIVIGINKHGGSISAWVKLMSDHRVEPSPVKGVTTDADVRRRPHSAGVIPTAVQQSQPIILKNDDEEDNKIMVMKYNHSDKGRRPSSASPYAYSSLPFTSAPLVATHNQMGHRSVRMQQEYQDEASLSYSDEEDDGSPMMQLSPIQPSYRLQSGRGSWGE